MYTDVGSTMKISTRETEYRNHGKVRGFFFGINKLRAIGDRRKRLFVPVTRCVAIAIHPQNQ